MDFVEKSDCLLVIGTALMTALANKIVDNFLDKQLPVIEINVESAINRGNYIKVEGK